MVIRFMALFLTDHKVRNPAPTVKPLTYHPVSRYNLIYGWNGTGKSTISGLFQHLRSGTVPSYESTLSIDGQSLRSQDLGLAKREVRVFNRDFIDRNVFHAGGTDLPLILTLGERSVQSQQELDGLRSAKESLNTAARDAKGSVRRAEKALDEHCVNRARDIKDLLTSEGSNPYRQYDKRDYKKTATRIAGDNDPGRFVLSESVVASERAIHSASSKDSLDEIEFDFPDLSGLT
ncbi:MAG: AAA family ATPase, partial [Chloroflexi bacterium]|nr:AAA family ATPase [Chloroflexota bacterium]